MPSMTIRVECYPPWPAGRQKNTGIDSAAVITTSITDSVSQVLKTVSCTKSGTPTGIGIYGV